MTRTADSRTFVVGDVHGCDVALGLLLDRMALTRDDRLVLLGDIVDRGPHSRPVVEMLQDISRSCRFNLVMGNHEEMLLDAVRNPRSAAFWLECGGEATLDSYGGRLGNIPDAHLDFLASACPYVETDADVFVHASLEPDVPLDLQTGDWLRWQKLTGWERPHSSGKRVICGHTEMPGGVPRVIDGWVMLDTAAYRGGFLTALELASGELWQASQRGDFRAGVRLDEL